MRLGISASFPHSSPEEWAELHQKAGLGAVVFPLNWKANVSDIDRYAAAARSRDLVISEVGAWCNPMDPDPDKRRENRLHCLRQLELAEYVGAVCCVNISGAVGEVWDGGYAENFSDRTREEVVSYVRDLIDTVKPARAKYALEPMPNMIPDSPAAYETLIAAIDRPAFGVHVDIVNMLSSPRVYFGNRDLIRETFSRLGSKICSCHLKDAILEQRLTVSIRETPCGTGGLDIGTYIREAERVNPEMPMIIEHLSSMEEYVRSIAYVKALV
ncbi:MAG: sugar phosphate isomerase/epimerase [Clostridia bacterium]|nr:sugar phosphate isomerase/epimerase [Clostridia bacterium]